MGVREQNREHGWLRKEGEGLPEAPPRGNRMRPKDAPPELLTNPKKVTEKQRAPGPAPRKPIV